MSEPTEAELIHQSVYQIFRLANGCLEMSHCENVSPNNKRLMMQGPFEQMRQLMAQVESHAPRREGEAGE